MNGSKVPYSYIESGEAHQPTSMDNRRNPPPPAAVAAASYVNQHQQYCTSSHGDVTVPRL